MTEDDAHGGLEAVLAQVLERYGLPEAAGLTGLLRHLQGSRAMTEWAQKETIRLLLEQIAAFENGIRQMKEEGAIVDLFAAAELAEGLRDRLADMPDAVPPPLYENVDLPDPDGPAPESLHERVRDALHTRGKYAEPGLRPATRDANLDGFVTGVKESFPRYDAPHTSPAAAEDAQYDTDHRHVPKPEQKEDHDEGR